MTRSEPPAGDLLHRGVGYVEPVNGPIPDGEWEQIQSFMDTRILDTVSPADVFTFRLIACSDGLDSYYTNHDEKTGLRNFVKDLEKGQSVLGSHDYGTFSYGTSYDADLRKADESMKEYEPTAYPQYANKDEYRTTKWVVGKYYMPRNTNLNGHNTDDLIKGMQLGAIRKTSISFMVGRYICSIDQRDLLDGWEMLWDPDASAEDLEEACFHMPGVVYKGKLCTAKMHDETLHETSLVFKNASPSSMYMRKAEGLAQRGMLPAADRIRIEERIGQRLPDPQRKLWTPGSKEAAMARRETPTEETEETPQPTAEPTQPPEAPEGEPQTTPQGEEGETQPTEETTEEGVEHHEAEGTVGEVAESLATVVEEAVDDLPTEDREQLVAAVRRIDRSLGDAGFERTLSAEVARSYEVRERALTEALGGKEPTVEVIRSLNSEAELGRTMVNELITEVVQERIRAQGEGQFQRDLYRRTLEASLTALSPQEAITYLRSEKASWKESTTKRFTPGRSVQAPAPATTAQRDLPKAMPKAASNVFSRDE